MNITPLTDKIESKILDLMDDDEILQRAIVLLESGIF